MDAFFIPAPSEALNKNAFGIRYGTRFRRCGHSRARSGPGLASTQNPRSRPAGKDLRDLQGHQVIRPVLPQTPPGTLKICISGRIFAKETAASKCSAGSVYFSWEEGEVPVWDKSENGDWHCTASWKTHSGSVWRVTWAHPEFGQVLASCSFDRTAAVWEEIVGESNDKLRGQSHWVKRTTLVDSRTSVTDVKFAPKHMGLMLATCSADGVVRIYEAPDVMNLSQWSLQHEISCKLSCSCISWNPSSSRAHSPMIAVGSDDNSPNILAKVQIYEYNENTRKYAKAEALMTVTDPVHDIAFAPNLGRSFHILAVATKDVRIFTLKPLRKELTSSGGLTKFEIHIVAQFDNHNSQVWRVSWNITGTVLASSGDDGCVRLWKANYMDNWKCTGILKGNGSPVNGSSQQGIFNASLGSANTSLQNSLNGSSASRYFFPPLDSPRAGSRWSSHAQLLPPPPLIEQSCDADTANLQYPHPRRRCVSRPLNLLPENEGV
ncbi:PREDICTED: nucleoporin SEH1 [Ficedula albicollis]|uniref:nucleoporin SEH1 n=1 Tax=Ficedula albicollis TaxID=59894 RepID=UPI00035933E0|nr:PREDICTED: nucleoporin SEH1 [Ficedula albicollis]